MTSVTAMFTCNGAQFKLFSLQHLFSDSNDLVYFKCFFYGPSVPPVPLNQLGSLLRACRPVRRFHIPVPCIDRACNCTALDMAIPLIN